MAVKKKKIKVKENQTEQQNGGSAQKVASADTDPKQKNATDQNTVTKLDKNEGGAKKQHKKRRKGLYKRLADQLEFYFSDANLRASSRKDGYMMQLIKKDPWVPLNIFDKFNKIKTMIAEFEEGTMEEHLVKALEVKKSTLLELSEDGTKVRRVSKVQDKSNVEECTIYIENIPTDASHDGLKNRFKQFGPVAYVSLPKYRHSQKAKGFAFIEFESLEGVKSVLKACGVKEDALPDLPDPASLASIRTFNQEGEEGKSNEGEHLKRKHDADDDDFDAPKRLRIDENQKKQRTDKPAAEDEVKEEDKGEEKGKEEKSEADILSLHGFRILTKTQWRKLRNQYLNQQRKNVSAAKALLRSKAGDGRSKTEEGGRNSKSEPKLLEGGGKVESKKGEPPEKKEEPKVEEETKKPRVEFVPGLILRIQVQGGIDDVKSVKRRLREVEEVGYVDARIGDPQFFVRCKSEEQTDKFLSTKFDNWELIKLKDTEEAEYWKKIAKDMEDKKTGKVVVPKIKKKKRLLDKLEKSTHIHFD